MGKIRPLHHVPPKQFGQLKKIFPHFSNKEIQQKWVELQKSNKAHQLKLRNKFLVNPSVNIQSGSCANVNIPMCQIQQKWAKLQMTGNPNPLDNRFSANLPIQARPNTCAHSHIPMKDVGGVSK